MVTSVNQRLLFLSFACYVVICVIPIFDLLIDGRKNKEAVVEMSYFSSGFGCLLLLVYCSIVVFHIYAV